MTSTRGKDGLRPLGSVRQCADHRDMNVSGNAMATPPSIPQKLSKTHVVTNVENKLKQTQLMTIIKMKQQKTVTHACTLKTKSMDNGGDSIDILADQRITEVSDERLHREIEELKETVNDKSKLLAIKEGEVTQLEESLVMQEEYYKNLYEKERMEHANTKQLLCDTEERLAYIEHQMSCQRSHYETSLQELEQKLINDLQTLRSSKDDEIDKLGASHQIELSDREDKIKKLKQQMADTLKGNSWERQQQLEELTKELSRLQEESDDLRMALKVKDRRSSCSNCQSLQATLERTRNAVAQKELSISELNEMCYKFSLQLKKYEHQNGDCNKSTAAQNTKSPTK